MLTKMLTTRKARDARAFDARRCSDRTRLNLHPESRCLHAIPVLFEIRWGSRRDEQVL
jgi:hypothetical protein